MPLNEDDMQLIAKLLQTNNAELSKQFATPDSVGKMVEQGLQKGLSTLDFDAKLAQLKEGLTPTGDKGGKGDGATGAQDDALAAAEARAKAELEKLQATIKRETEARQAAEATAAQQRLDNELRSALDGAEIPSNRHPQAIAYLRTLTTADGKRVVHMDDQGNIQFLAQRKGYVDEMSLRDGIAEWSGTDDGKTYLPPTQAQGTGEGAGSRTVPRTSEGKTDWSALREATVTKIAQTDLSEI